MFLLEEARSGAPLSFVVVIPLDASRWLADTDAAVDAAKTAPDQVSILSPVRNTGSRKTVEIVPRLVVIVFKFFSSLMVPILWRPR